LARPLIAVVGPDSLIGRELRDVLAQGDLAPDIRLVASESDEAGALKEIAGEPTVVGKLGPESFVDADAVVFAGTPESTDEAIKTALGPIPVDTTYRAEDHPRARLRAPMVEAEETAVPEDTVHVIAHPAAIALALVLGRLQDAHPIVRAVCHIFEPASERGTKGIDELQQQTTNLLSFRTLPKQIYDAQVSFNVLPRYGEDAPAPLEQSEIRIERHLASLLSRWSTVPMPSLRLIQVPVFHGHSFSIWVELEDNPGPAAIEDALSGDPVDLRAAGEDPPNIVGNAGQGGVAVGAITQDRNDTNACWIWMVSDNLRVVAENAVAVLRQALAAR
jgi:aspartate-semialdehyde dehydrogenase